MKRYFLFRGYRVFAVDSENGTLPVEAVGLSDFVFELDQFGMLYSVKDRTTSRFRLFDYAEMFEHVRLHKELIVDGIPLVSMTEIVENLRNASYEACNGVSR